MNYRLYHLYLSTRYYCYLLGRQLSRFTIIVITDCMLQLQFLPPFNKLTNATFLQINLNFRSSGAYSLLNIEFN